jgi:hypothetical protein
MVGLGDGTAPPTAVFFPEQTVDGLVTAMRAFETAADRFDPRALRARAAAFDRPMFARRVRQWIDARWGDAQARRAC